MQRIESLGVEGRLSRVGLASLGGSPKAMIMSLASSHQMMGPLTVPQIAEMRPTSRQRMQRLADELAADGLVRFVDNPKHRRSKLVQLTSRGEKRYRDLNARLLTISATMGEALREPEIRRAAGIVRQLSEEVNARS